MAAMADSCLAAAEWEAEEEEMEAVFCEDSTWWDKEEVMAVLCLRSIEDACSRREEAEAITLEEEDAIWEDDEI